MNSILARITAKAACGIIGLGGWVGVGLIMMLRPNTPDGMVVFQSFNAVAIMIFGYYFGSSSGSAVKTEHINAQNVALTTALAGQQSAPTPPEVMPPLAGPGHT